MAANNHEPWLVDLMALFALTAFFVGIMALSKQQASHPFYLKIEVQYGK